MRTISIWQPAKHFQNSLVGLLQCLDGPLWSEYDYVADGGLPLMSGM